MAMKSADEIGFTFANLLVGSGMYNNVVNLQLAAYAFSLNEDNTAIDRDPLVTLRLRMDVMCAVQIRDRLNAMLKGIELPSPPSEAPKPNGSDESTEGTEGISIGDTLDDPVSLN